MTIRYNLINQFGKQKIEDYLTNNINNCETLLVNRTNRYNSDYVNINQLMFIDIIDEYINGKMMT